MAGGAPLGGPAVNPFKQRIVGQGYGVAFCLVTSLFFLWGFCYGLLDVLNKHFQNVLGITKLQSTGLQVAYFGIGYFAFSPVAGEVLRRRGYKTAILMGLALYSTGAILFWPVAHFSATGSHSAIFAGFVCCTAVVACGLATLEVTANSYVTVMPPSGPASFRLQFSQSWNGVASFVGPLIASKFFFSGTGSGNLNTVQYVYMAVAGMGALLALAFVFTRLPEVSEADLQAEADALAESNGGHADAQLAKPFIRQTRALLGFLAQFMYVGAQVTIGSFFINYLVEDAGKTDAEASNMLSYSLIIFTVFRFVASALLTVFSSSFILLVNATLCALFIAIAAGSKGNTGIAALMITYACMAPQYPVIFVLSTEGLGRHTRRAASLLVMGVAGGAIFPPIQGAIADAASTKVSYWINFPAFLYVVFFAAYCWRAKGFKFTVAGEARRQLQLDGAQREKYDAEASSTNMDEKKQDLAELETIERI